LRQKRDGEEQAGGQAPSAYDAVPPFSKSVVIRFPGHHTSVAEDQNRDLKVDDDPDHIDHRSDERA
jgi:hypothetical protein